MARARAAGWRVQRVGGGGLLRTGDGLRLLNPPTPEGCRASAPYVNAQIDDHAGLARRAFPRTPPLQMRLRARFSHPAQALRGTAGFGFWNDPFLMNGTFPPALPQAAWFFFSAPPTDLPLALDLPGHGWKAMALDAAHPSAAALLPAALPLLPAWLLLAQSRPLYRALWPPVQRLLRAQERLLDVEMTGWHDYTLDWRPDGLRFAVDGAPLLETDSAPRGPLGFVAWIDNQYLVATPQGRVRWGTVARETPQWLDLAALDVG